MSQTERQSVTMVLDVDKEGVERAWEITDADGRARGLISFDDSAPKVLKKVVDVIIRSADRAGHCRVVEFSNRRVVDDIAYEPAPQKPEEPPPEAEREPPPEQRCLVCDSPLLEGQTKPRPSRVSGVPDFAVWACAICGLVAKVGDKEPAVVNLDKLEELPPVVIFVAGSVGKAAADAADVLDRATAAKKLAGSFVDTLKKALEKASKEKQEA